MNITVTYLILAILISSIVLVYAWSNPQTRGSRFFTVACFASILWMTGDVVGRLSTTFEGQFIGEAVRYLGIGIVPVALLVFTFQYCRREISSRTISLLFVVPVISWFVLLTNSWHFLFFKTAATNPSGAMSVEFGFYFWFIHLPYSYGLILATFFTIIIELNRSPVIYRPQLRLLLTALSIPFVFNVIGLTKLIPNFYYTPLAIPVCFTIMSYAIFRHEFLGTSPIGYQTVFQTIRDGVLILDRYDVIRDINPAAASGLAKLPTEIIGMHVRDAFAPWPSAVELYDKNPVKLGEIKVELLNQTRYLSIESTALATQSGEYEGRIVAIHDITDRYTHLLSLEAMAFHDPLTRLANRRKFTEEVERAIESYDEKSQSIAILYFDIDRFKSVNDTYGHEAGDELLKYVAARVASILRKPDILARLGGDEFGLLLHNCDEERIDLVIERLHESVQRPFKVGEQILVASFSLGAAFYPKHGKDLAELLRHADAEMYKAKQNSSEASLPNLRLDSAADREM